MGFSKARTFGWTLASHLFSVVLNWANAQCIGHAKCPGLAYFASIFALLLSNLKDKLSLFFLIA